MIYWTLITTRRGRMVLLFLFSLCQFLLFCVFWSGCAVCFFSWLLPFLLL